MTGAGRSTGPSAQDCPILHVDMDAFYAAVMTRDRPELRDRPVIVGGGDRGVVLSASYAARTSGVRSGIPMTRARRLCPQALVIRPDYDLFTTVSISVMEIFRRVTPAVEALSLDEAFLDVSGAARRLGGPVAVAERIRAQVADEQGITCSVGVAGDGRGGQDRQPPRQARRRGRRTPGAGDLLPPPAGGDRAVGGGGEDRRAAPPARAAHGRRPRPHPPTDPAAGARAG